MAKTKISSTDLIWIFREKLSSFDDCPPSLPIAIVPSDGSWTALTPHYVRKDTLIASSESSRFKSSFVKFTPWLRIELRPAILRLGASGRGGGERVAALAMRRGKSVDFTGLLARHIVE